MKTITWNPVFLGHGTVPMLPPSPSFHVLRNSDGRVSDGQSLEWKPGHPQNRTRTNPLYGCWLCSLLPRCSPKRNERLWNLRCLPDCLHFATVVEWFQHKKRTPDEQTKTNEEEQAKGKSWNRGEGRKGCFGGRLWLRNQGHRCRNTNVWLGALQICWRKANKRQYSSNWKPESRQSHRIAFNCRAIPRGNGVLWKVEWVLHAQRHRQISREWWRSFDWQSVWQHLRWKGTEHRVEFTRRLSSKWSVFWLGRLQGTLSKRRRRDLFFLCVGILPECTGFAGIQSHGDCGILEQDCWFGRH